jgi:hypothetical protein
MRKEKDIYGLRDDVDVSWAFFSFGFPCPHCLPVISCHSVILQMFLAIVVVVIIPCTVHPTGSGSWGWVWVVCCFFIIIIGIVTWQ